LPATAQRSNVETLFDHVVGAGKEGLWNIEAKLFGKQKWNVQV